MSARVVRCILWTLVAVDSVDAAADRWRSLGFRLADPRLWQGCRSVDIRLRQGGIRLLSPVATTTATGAAESTAVDALRVGLNRRLQLQGEGLVGWTWVASNERPAARQSIRAVDPTLTPGALTLIEAGGETGGDPRQRNRTTAIDHIVLAAGEVDKTAATYARAFSLRAHSKEMNGRRFAFLKVGGPVIEITGPFLPDATVAPKLWGLALRSDDLEATVAAARASDIEVSDPNAAIQGGRIVSLPSPICGVPLAWLGT